MLLRNNLILLTIIAGIVLLQGCVAIQSHPTVARGGDTITLFVGSPSGMTKENTTARYVSDVDGTPVDLTIRSIIRIRPDQTSKAALFDSYVQSESDYTGHSPWMTVIIADLPQGLTVGTGHVDIASTASYGTLPHGVNDIPISLEIIDGIGTASSFTYNNGFGGLTPVSLAALEPLPQVVVQPPTMGTTYIAAAEIKVNIPTLNPNTGNSVPKHAIRVVADDFYTMNPKEQVQMSWSKNGDEITVNFISPTGWMKPLQLRFSVVLNVGGTFVTEPGPSMVSVNAYDIDGNKILLAGGATPDANLFHIGIE